MTAAPMLAVGVGPSVAKAVTIATRFLTVYLFPRHIVFPARRR